MGVEKVTEKNIRKNLKAEGFLTQKIHVGRYGPVGFPDLLVIRGGITSYFEIKAPDKTPDHIQNYQMKELRKAGCIAEPVWSYNDIVRILRKGGLWK